MMTRNAPVITIDGPVGSGKGTVAGRLAARLGWHLLDSGALYRLVALKALHEAVGVDDARGLEALARNIDFGLEFDGAGVCAVLDGEDVTGALRAEAVSAMASKVAVQPRVRGALVERQRAFRQPPGLVADGRDMGTVLFPDAALKVFLTASVQARAERRYKQLKAKGENVNLSRLFRDLEERDARDRNRAIAPLKPAPDSVVIDSTELGPDDVVDQIYKLAQKSELTD